MTSDIGVLRVTRDEVLKVEWQIEDFLSLAIPAGTKYNSPPFKFLDYSWYLQIYPYGSKNYDDMGNIALYLCQSENVSTVIVTFERGIKKADGTLCSEDSFTWKFCKNVGYGFGWSRLLSRSELLQRETELLPSGALTISCTLKQPLSPKGLSPLSSDFGNALLSAKHSDVTIQVEAKAYKAHKLVLTTRCPVFAGMFDYDTAEKNSGVVSIVDCDPESFKDFLHFLYTGRADITESNVFHLFRTADKYCVEELKSHCVAFMMQNLSVHNVCDIAALGHQYSQDDLKQCCLHFFEENIQSILSSSEWESLITENPYVANKLLKNVAPKLKIQQ